MSMYETWFGGIGFLPFPAVLRRSKTIVPVCSPGRPGGRKKFISGTRGWGGWGEILSALLCGTPGKHSLLMIEFLYGKPFDLMCVLLSRTGPAGKMVYKCCVVKLGFCCLRKIFSCVKNILLFNWRSMLC